MMAKFTIFLFFWLFGLAPTFASGNDGFVNTGDTIPLSDSLDLPNSSDAFHELWSKVSKAKSRNNIKDLAGSYRQLATYYADYGRVDSALYCLKLAEAIYSKHGDKPELAQTYLALNRIYSLKAEYLEAMNVTYKALNIYETKKDEKGIAECYSNIANLLYYSERNEQSVEYSNKAIAIQKKLGLKRDMADSYYAKACSELFIVGSMDSALASTNAALKLYEELGENGYDYMKALNWRGNVYKYLGQYNNALEDYNVNLENATKQKIKHYELASYANIGHVYLLNGEYAKALPNNLKAIAMMKETGDMGNLWENYMHVSNAYENLGQADSALKYEKLYGETYVDYLNSIIARQETEAEVKYETFKKNETINAQAEELIAHEQIQRRYTFIAAVLFLGILLLIFSYLKRQKRNHQLRLLNDRLDAKNRQNELLMKEIHHRVKNNLEMVKSLLALQSAKTDDPASREAILAGQSRVQSMGIIHQKLYRGNNLDSIEMKDYFENLTEDIIDTFQAGNKVKIECDMDPLDLNIDTAIPIGLIVNELISNSLKYAFPDNRKGEIVLSLTQKSDGLHLRVSDNGIGFTLGSTPKGTGFGSQLIDLLTRQLNGVLCKENQTGTSLLFHFHPTKAA